MHRRARTSPTTPHPTTGPPPGRPPLPQCKPDHPSPTTPVLRHHPSIITTTTPWPNHSCPRAVARTRDPRPAQAILACCRTRLRLVRLGRAHGRNSKGMIRWGRRHMRILGCCRILCIAFEAVQSARGIDCCSVQWWEVGLVITGGANVPETAMVVTCQVLKHVVSVLRNV
jgi:hypothetical protein